jgi:hypothetical protein
MDLKIKSKMLILVFFSSYKYNIQPDTYPQNLWTTFPIAKNNLINIFPHKIVKMA